MWHWQDKIPLIHWFKHNFINENIQCHTHTVIVIPTYTNGNTKCSTDRIAFGASRKIHHV